MPERYLSRALQTMPGISHHTVSLAGVAAEIYNGLWRVIVNGQLKPGTKLQEEIIGETYGVSRTLVRKVLLIMEQEGIVELPANRGAYVATPTPTDARNIFEALRVTGAHIVSELAAPSRILGKDDIARLHQHIEQQASFEQNEDTGTGRILSGEFFMLLAYIHDNRIIATQYENLMTRVILVITHFRANPILPKRSEFQKTLVNQIVTHEQKAAVATFMAYHLAYENSVRFDEPQDEVDLRAILAGSGAGFAIPENKYVRKAGKNGI